jgi:toxin ParE1/3/4
VSADPLIVHPAAASELEEAHGWYAERSASAAERFLAEVDEGLRKIAAAPRRWPSYRVGTRRFILRRFPYSLVYQIIEERPRLLAVAHDRRRTAYWALRLG